VSEFLWTLFACVIVALCLSIYFKGREEGWNARQPEIDQCHAEIDEWDRKYSVIDVLLQLKMEQNAALRELKTDALIELGRQRWN
jgi:hypothetical protein